LPKNSCTFFQSFLFFVMPKTALYCLLLVLVLSLHVVAQPPAYTGLVRLPNATLAVYCTPGAEARTTAIAARCAKAIAWLKTPAELGFVPQVTLLVLGPKDWLRYAASGEPYGMPHTAAGNSLVVAAGSNALWENTLPPAASLPPATAKALAATYRNASGQLSLEKMFDLLALHELGHLYYRQAGLDRPRYWLEEFLPACCYTAILLPTSRPNCRRWSFTRR
jgi:hypothetical protein